MILVVAKAKVKDGSAEQFMEAAQACISSTLEEQGNISYTLLREAFDANSFTFLEQWESKQALDAHMKTRHFMVFGGSIQDLLAAELVIDVYDANKLG